MKDVVFAYYRLQDIYDADGQLSELSYLDNRVMLTKNLKWCSDS